MPYVANIDDLLARVAFASLETRRRDCLENIPTSHDGDRDVAATLDVILELIDEQHAMLRALLLIHGRDVSQSANETNE